jgi:hypothetical protein
MTMTAAATALLLPATYNHQFIIDRDRRHHHGITVMITSTP